MSKICPKDGTPCQVDYTCDQCDQYLKSCNGCPVNLEPSLKRINIKKIKPFKKTLNEGKSLTRGPIG